MRHTRRAAVVGIAILTVGIAVADAGQRPSQGRPQSGSGIDFDTARLSRQLIPVPKGGKAVA